MKKNLTVVTDQSILKQMLIDFGRLVTLEQFNQLTQHQYSRNSLLAFTKDWNLFLEFCQLRSVNAIPASTTAVRQFIEFEARSRKFSTLKRYAVTISLVHTLLGQRDPTTNSQVRTSLQRLRLDKHGDATQAQSFNQNHLNLLFEKLKDRQAIKTVRDLAIYHVMFECALKRSELKSLLTSQLVKLNNEQPNLSLLVAGYTYSLSEQASQCLLKWLTHIDDTNDALFRAIDRHGNVSTSPLDDSSIFRILRNAGRYLGDEQLRFSGQSTRIGAAKELAKQGYKAKEIQEFGRWLSPAMPYQYIGDKNTAEREKLKFVKFKPWE
ncbi:tyrosine-type recombinase/integrase [Vibrio fluvialis]|uniref:tyrosine-type recombinase/integrase n=1 Tax=Vibrio fluvialis TaxID=676 RepID=UPI0023800C7B|nr:tyrosine-type recombinase/integrase [Vibrio fluvialis]EKO3536397.1 tyrosine-type recombinase/integrase [Vibrio fluvialis]WDY54127.1 tyrosine-type recombinase/integrase [Vibrio fluvialis]